MSLLTGLLQHRLLMLNQVNLLFTCLLLLYLLTSLLCVPSRYSGIIGLILVRISFEAVFRDHVESRDVGPLEHKLAFGYAVSSLDYEHQLFVGILLNLMQ